MNPARAAKLDPEYLAFLRTLPCFCCFVDVYARLFKCPADIQASARTIYGRQKSPTEAAHVGLSSSRRGLSQKYPDAEAIALCKDHHTEARDSIHRLGPDAFFAEHRADRDATIAAFQKLWREHNA